MVGARIAVGYHRSGFGFGSDMAFVLRPPGACPLSGPMPVGPTLTMDSGVDDEARRRRCPASTTTLVGREATIECLSTACGRVASRSRRSITMSG